MTNVTEAIKFCKQLIDEEKMLKEQKAILQSDKFADTVPSVQTVIKDIDDYIAKIPDAIRSKLDEATVEPPKPVVITPADLIVAVIKALGVH